MMYQSGSFQQGCPPGQFVSSSSGVVGGAGQFVSSSSGAVAGPGSMVVYPPAGACAGCGPEANAGDCSGTCGGAEAVCFEPTSGVAQVQWVQTAYGGGGYRPVTSYQYVGEGCGNFQKEVVTTWTGWRLRRICCIPLLLCLLLIPFLIWMMWPTCDPYTDANHCCAANDRACFCAIVPDDPRCTLPPGPCQGLTTCGTPKQCTLFGDPHLRTFDNRRADYYTPGEYWVVKSPLVSIQGRYQPTHMTNGLSVTKALAIGGPFLQGHKLIIDVNNVYFDDQVVIAGFENIGATWQNAQTGIVIRYSSDGSTLQQGRVEMMRKKGVSMHSLHVSLPFKVNLMVNRWNLPDEGAYINAQITMPPVKQDNVTVQDGHCGNFNGNPEDDARLAVRSRVGRNGVAQQDMLFPGAKTPVQQVDRPDLNDCPPHSLNPAMELCKKAQNTQFPSHDCLIDKCFGNLTPLA